jgi:hypothetical protein
LRELRSHMEAALTALNTIDELRSLTTEEQAQRTAFERFCHSQERADARSKLGVTISQAV